MATPPQLPSVRASFVAVLLVVLAGCSGSSGGTTAGLTPGEGGPVTLVRLDYGQLVDVYGLRRDAGGEPAIELYRSDVLIGRNIVDQRPAGSPLLDAAITYDFLSVDPDTLQPRLFIPRDLEGSEFAAAFDALDDEVRRITPHLAGTGQPSLPFTAVPRNAAIRLTFSGSLGIDDSFFVERAPWGGVTLVRNHEAVQLLEITGDPGVPGALVRMPIRIVVGERDLILDPVLLGSEGNQYTTTNNATGMPPSPDRFHANVRLALAVDGPLAIPTMRGGGIGFEGQSGASQSAVVSDFRSGNDEDESEDLAGGFLRDSSPLRLLGEIPMFLERVDEVDAVTQEVTVYKNGLSHGIDRGDVLRFLDTAGERLGRAEVVADPVDDHGEPGVQHVRVRIRRLADLETVDPSNLPGYPASVAAREAWLLNNAPHAILLTEFHGAADDPSNFVRFTPAPLEVDGYRPRANEYVSPFAGAVVRFSKPVDIATVKSADTLFFATRDLCDPEKIEQFINERPFESGGQLNSGMRPESFDVAKYRTPHLVAATVFDEDGSQTCLRLQPTVGFYLDDTMRNAPSGVDYRYFLHMVSDSPDGGIRDLAGQSLDLQGEVTAAAQHTVIPFSVDTRTSNGQPVFEDNLAVSVVRRFAARDEDENPSYYLPAEVRGFDQAQRAPALELPDVFGASVYADGRLYARPTSRGRVVADDVNQPSAPSHSWSQQNPLAWCPPTVSSEEQVGANTASHPMPEGEANPMNPYGCRMQTVWREVDLGLSRADPFDFNLDIEQMYWAPTAGSQIVFDEFDRTSLWLGHSEFRPSPCIGRFSALPSLPDSGLRTAFEGNFAGNPAPVGVGTATQSQAPRRVAYEDASLVMDPADVVFEPNGVNRYLPLPEFQRPYFVFRDETVTEQGGRSNTSMGSDLSASLHVPYILSPFTMGQGRRLIDVDGGAGDVRLVHSYWNDGRSRMLANAGQMDNYTGGLVGSIALPLLADFWTYCDSSELPAGGGYIALGTNTWQASLPGGRTQIPYIFNPAFRVLSGGRPPVGGLPPICRAPGDSQWQVASGGYTSTGGGTPSRSRTFYWMMMDVLKRQSVLTNGFVDLYNPHRVPEGFADARLGPFFLTNGSVNVPPNVSPTLGYTTEPPLSELPEGTTFQPQFRGASAVDPEPFYWQAWISSATPLFGTEYDAAMRAQLKPTDQNFPLDPYKAGDAHLRKWDNRPLAGSSQARNWWTHLYNRTVTSYVDDPADLLDLAFTQNFSGPNETFTPADVRYVNWRFVASNNVDANPPTTPSIDTFTLTYRWQVQ